MARSSRGDAKRACLVKAAQDAFHEKGIRRTSLADVARRSGVPLGNVYYYYRSKEALVHAVIESRAHEVEMALERAGQEPDDVARLVAFLRWGSAQAERKARLGCPLAGLRFEVARESETLLPDAEAMIDSQRSWLAARFGATGPHAQNLAEELLAAVQGAVALAHLLGEPDILRRRMRALEAWVRARAGAR